MPRDPERRLAAIEERVSPTEPAVYCRTMPAEFFDLDDEAKAHAITALGVTGPVMLAPEQLSRAEWSTRYTPKANGPPGGTS